MATTRKCINCRYSFVEVHSSFRKVACFHEAAGGIGLGVDLAVSPKGHCGHIQKNFELHPLYPEGRDFMLKGKS